MMYWVVIILKIVYIFNSILLKNKKKIWEMGERKGEMGCQGWTDFVFFTRN